MTGFASKTATLSYNDTQFYATVSIKSVNARFFENACKFPYALHHLETDISKLLKKHILRGHLFTAINISDQSILKGAISGSISVAKNYIKAAQDIQKATGIPGTVTISDLALLPYVFVNEEQLIDEEIKKQLLQLVGEVMQLLIKEEEREGLAMQQDLSERLQIAEEKIQKIEECHNVFMAKRKQQIMDEVEQYAAAEDQVVETRKAALYYMLDKIDIHEEIVRFKSHAKNLSELIASPAIELGKRIDFTLQELTREINTISAKASDAHMSSYAIDIKVELEKAREQVQNIV
jgi:uncharacterized protein (TIGR00255 family)